jgi:microsomal epoxide hydrolase
VSDERLADLRQRLQSIDWDRLPADDLGRYGAPLNEIRDVVDFWLSEYSWRRWEESLNDRPHFLATVDGLDLHYWHIRSGQQGAIPLLLLHGWPGSVIEFWDLIEPLADPAAHQAPDAPAFDVILAELPGFGFGGKPAEPGWGPARMAGALGRLMHDVLGYSRFAVHGEDWGSIVAAGIARQYPEHAAAIHITMPYTPPHGEFAPATEWEAQLTAIGGYSLVQSQVPDALTLGMTDSPLALTAWILEKFLAWSDNDGTLRSAFDYEHLVTNLHFYWLTSSIVSSTRIYRESALDEDEIVVPPQIPVPAGIASFPKEPFGSPREWLEDVYDIRRYSVFESGGHFAALEQPGVVLKELREFCPGFFAHE